MYRNTKNSGDSINIVAFPTKIVSILYPAINIQRMSFHSGESIGDCKQPG